MGITHHLKAGVSRMEISLRRQGARKPTSLMYHVLKSIYSDLMTLICGN